MKQGKLQVGTRGGKNVDAVIRLPETAADCLVLANNSEPHMVARFTRGWRIWLQDAIARPMFAAGKSLPEIQAEIDSADMTAERVRLPRAPTSVTFPKTRDGMIPVELATSIMQKAGINVVVE